MKASAACLTAALLAFGSTLLLGLAVIPRLWLRQTGRMVPAVGRAPQTQSLPLPGGLLPLIGCVAAVAVTCVTDGLLHGQLLAAGSPAVQAQYSMFGCGALTALAFGWFGFLQDLPQMRGLRQGMTLRQRGMLGLLICLADLTALYMSMQGAPYFYLPLFGVLEIGFFHWIFGLLFLSGTVCAVRCAEPMPGLCALITAISAAALGGIAGGKGHSGFAMAAAALTGAALAAFLQRKRVRLGATGALFFGGALAGLAYGVRCPLILLPVGLSFWLDGGARLLHHAPLHRRMQANGTKETTILAAYAGLQALGAAAAGALLYFGGYFG